MNINSARLLVFHGSRNQQYPFLIDRLASLVAEYLSLKTLSTNKLKQPALQSTATASISKFSPSHSLVESAVLEFGDITLAQKIVRFSQKAIALNYQRVSIIPVFLAAGVHVREDIPQEIAIAKQLIGNNIKIELFDYLGKNHQLKTLLEQKFTRVPNSARILLAHGSRLSQGNVSSEQLARDLCAKIAYWTIKPSLTSTVELLATQNISSITIVPYFLFSGRITEAIANKVAELQNQFPNANLVLDRPFGATVELARIIAESTF